MRKTAIFLILIFSSSTFAGCTGERGNSQNNPLTNQEEYLVDCASNRSLLTMDQINSTFTLAEEKISLGMRNYPNYPLGALENESLYQVSNVDYWTSGFFPSELWIMASNTSNESWMNISRNWTDEIINTSYHPSSHDLWFMKGMPLSMAIEIDTNNTMKIRYQQGINDAANALATRWNSTIGAIQSSTYTGDFGVIIDSAVNQVLLLSPYLTNDTRLNVTQYGLEHLTFLQNYFIRSDGSTVHRMTFNSTTGNPIEIIPGQGLNLESTWSRGQAWAVTGFSEAYALTKNESFLQSARTTADYFIQNVPSGCMATWDLDLFGESHDVPLDTSASAILCYGLLVLAESEIDPIKANLYQEYAMFTLGALVRNHLSNDSSNPGILLEQTYNVNRDSRTGSYVWGDVYLLLSLNMLKTQLFNE